MIKVIARAIAVCLGVFVVASCIVIVASLLTGCKGSISQPVISYSVSMGDSYLKESIHMVDRKIVSIDLDTTMPGNAVFRIKMEDKVQIGQKIVTIPWDVAISFQEGKNFRVLK